AGVQWFMGTLIGRLILFGYTWALIHHMLGGVRHLIWDTGRGLGPGEREWLARATLFRSISLTVVLWIAGLLIVVGGGARGRRFLDELAAAARPRPRPRLGPLGHAAVLASAPDLDRLDPAVDLLRRAGGLADRPQPRRHGADPRLGLDRHPDAAV